MFTSHRTTVVGGEGVYHVTPVGNHILEFLSNNRPPIPADGYFIFISASS